MILYGFYFGVFELYSQHYEKSLQLSYLEIDIEGMFYIYGLIWI